MQLLLRSGERLRRCRGDRLRTYRQLLTADARRASHSEQETALLLRQLYGFAWPGVKDGALVQETDRFAAWAFRQPGFSTTCQGIRSRAQHLCDAARANGRCEFAEKLVAEGNALRAKQKEQDRFEALGWPEVLAELHGGAGRVAAGCYLTLRDKMVRLGLTYDDTIFCAMREFQSSIGTPVALSLVCAAVHLLVGHGLLEVVEKGKSGSPEKNQAGKASGYRVVLPTPTPPGDGTSPEGAEGNAALDPPFPITSHMCSRSQEAGRGL